MNKVLILSICLLVITALSFPAVTNALCSSPPLAYYMSAPIEFTCNEVTPGIEFTNPVDDSLWTINTVDASDNIVNVIDETPFYVQVFWRSWLWGAGYMPHLYAPGDYSAVSMTWKESWDGSPEYTGSNNGSILNLPDIMDRDPIDDYDPNFVHKIVNFSGVTRGHTLIMAQEQVFHGWGYPSPWAGPDNELITWTFGPFVIYSMPVFVLRILATPAWNSDIYISDSQFNACAVLPARILDTPLSYYPSFQAAYDDTDDGETIQIQRIEFEEDFEMDISKSVILHGGYNCNYTSDTGVTVIIGDVTISEGTVIIQSGTFEVRQL